MNKFEILAHKYKKILFENGISSELINGKRVDNGYYEDVKATVILAKHFGMGNHKTFSSFLEMVSTEDEHLISTLLFIIDMNNHQRFADKKDFKDIGEPNDEESFDTFYEKHFSENDSNATQHTENHVFTKHGQKYQMQKGNAEAPSTKAIPINKGAADKLDVFLLEHNCSKSEIAEHRRKVESGEIIVPKCQVDHIDKKYLLNMSPEEFAESLKQMNNYQNNSKNFKIKFMTDHGKSKK